MSSDSSPRDEDLSGSDLSAGLRHFGGDSLDLGVVKELHVSFVVVSERRVGGDVAAGEPSARCRDER